MIKQILEVLKPRRKILILTHNNPDPDTLAAAFGLKYILQKVLQKRCTIAYHGIVGRAENRELVRQCGIDIYPSTMLDFSRYDGLVVVDTQPTAGNVYIPKGYFPDVIIDHHNFRDPTKKAKVYDIRNDYGSTSSIITEYCKELGIICDQNIATALFYGIRTDTVGAGRQNNRIDLAMMSYVLPHISLKKLSKIETPEIPKYYYKNIKIALENAQIYGDLIFCDLKDVRNADLIAETSDFFLRMRDIKWSFVIGRVDNMAFFSLRCKQSKRKVGMIALGIVKGIGTGGGHMKSAGGQIPLAKASEYENYVIEIKRRLIKKINLKVNEPKTI
ncbi:MAG: bifunctional oligoribonuclease/PAP phosphatase NrnA [Calditerrivibrio sp.]|nr:bifunctional oligoribonuclease/PAP phosphatase NrnA [Calditerrivibrio sp.]